MQVGAPARLSQEARAGLMRFSLCTADFDANFGAMVDALFAEKYPELLELGLLDEVRAPRLVASACCCTPTMAC